MRPRYVTKYVNSRFLYPAFSGAAPCPGAFPAPEPAGAGPGFGPREAHRLSCRGDAGLSGTSSRPPFLGPWNPAMGAEAPRRPFVEVREAMEGFAEMPALGPDSADWMEVMEGLGARGAAVTEAPAGGVPGGSRGGGVVFGAREGPGLGLGSAIGGDVRGIGMVV